MTLVGIAAREPNRAVWRRKVDVDWDCDCEVERVWSKKWRDRSYAC